MGCIQSGPEAQIQKFKPMLSKIEAGIKIKSWINN